MPDTIHVTFERLATPVFRDLPMRVVVTGPFSRRGGAAFTARVGDQALRGVSFEPDGTGFVGYLARTPRADESLILRRGSLEVDTGARFRLPAGAAALADGEDDDSELLYGDVPQG